MVSTDDLVWTYPFLHLASTDRPKMLLQNIHNHASPPLYCVLTQTTFWIVTTVSTSTKIKNCGFDGDVTMGKLNYIRAAYCYYTAFNIILFPPTVHTVITCLKKLRKQTILVSIYSHWSGPHMWNFKILIQLYHKKT
jgi:hypothetical protein